MTDSAYVLGVAITQTYVSAGDLPFAQGEEVRSKNGAVILGRAVSGIATGSLVCYTPSSSTASASVDLFLASVANATGKLFAVALTSINSAEYGWVHTECNKEGKVRSGVAETGVPLFLTTTGGLVDDAVTSGKALTGLFILASVASASTPAAIWSNISLDRSTIA
jgi:hypothetical protein